MEKLKLILLLKTRTKDPQKLEEIASALGLITIYKEKLL
jgi:hypothetical protein